MMAFFEIFLHLVIIGCLCLISWIDVKTLTIPDFLVSAILFSAFTISFLTNRGSVLSSFSGMILAMGLMLLCSLGASRMAGVMALGGGDIKLAAALGAWVGVLDVSWMLLGAAAIGLAVFGVRTLVSGKPSARYIPFAPCLALSAIVVIIAQPSRWLEMQLSGAILS